MAGMILQFAGSLAAVILLILAAWWLRLGGEAKIADEAEARELAYLWREPGWSHDGSRDTSDTIRARWLGRERPMQERGPQPPSREPFNAA